MRNFAKIALVLTGLIGLIGCCVKMIDFAKSKDHLDLIWMILIFIGTFVSFVGLRIHLSDYMGHKRKKTGNFTKKDFNAISTSSIQMAFSDSGTDEDYKEWIDMKELKD